MVGLSTLPITNTSCSVRIVLYRKAGLLSIGERANIEIQSYINSLKACGVSHDVFTGSEANRRYPDQLKLPDRYNCVYEPHAGVLRANRAVITLQVKPSNIYND